MPWSEWILTAVTAVSLGDSYAALQTVPIEEQLDLDTVEIAEAGSFAVFWNNTFEEWSPVVAELEGPVVVFMSMGSNDETSTFQTPPEVVAQRCREVILKLLLLREDLSIIQTGYNGTAAEVWFPEFLPPPGERYIYVETSQLDRRLQFRDAAHPDIHGFSKRIRYVTHQVP